VEKTSKYNCRKLLLLLLVVVVVVVVVVIVLAVVTAITGAAATVENWRTMTSSFKGITLNLTRSTIT